LAEQRRRLTVLAGDTGDILGYPLSAPWSDIPEMVLYPEILA